MRIQILFFGSLTDITGSTTLEMPPVPDTDTLRRELFRLYPALAEARFAVALDQKIVAENTVVPPGCTVALLPPFSGG